MSLEQALKDHARIVEGNTRALAIVAERLAYLGKLLGTAALNVKPIELETALVEIEQGLIEVDAHGVPWDDRIHSAGQNKTDDGFWRRKKGVSEEEFNRIKDELLAEVRKRALSAKRAEKKQQTAVGIVEDAPIEVHTPEPSDTAEAPWVEQPESEPEPDILADKVIAAPVGIEEDSVETPTWTIDDLRERARVAGKANGKDFVFGVLERFGAKSLTDLAQDQYHAFVTALEAAK